MDFRSEDDSFRVALPLVKEEASRHVGRPNLVEGIDHVDKTKLPRVLNKVTFVDLAAVVAAALIEERACL